MDERHAPASRKVLELRIGQIVRGVLVEMLDNREALMNINGVSVRARLEAELPVGQGALLQVQPGSNNNTIVLKPLAGASELAPDEALRNVLKQFGLPDQKWSYELLRGLRRDGYALDGDTAAAFREAAALKPASAEPASWMATADVAFRRGLPITETTLAALRQALYGPPLHEELTRFTQLFQQSTDRFTPMRDRPRRGRRTCSNCCSKATVCSRLAARCWRMSRCRLRRRPHPRQPEPAQPADRPRRQASAQIRPLPIAGTRRPQSCGRDAPASKRCSSDDSGKRKPRLVCGSRRMRDRIQALRPLPRARPAEPRPRKSRERRSKLPCAKCRLRRLPALCSPSRRSSPPRLPEQCNKLARTLFAMARCRS